jgi:hypothetical protein
VPPAGESGVCCWTNAPHPDLLWLCSQEEEAARPLCAHIYKYTYIYNYIYIIDIQATWSDIWVWNLEIYCSFCKSNVNFLDKPHWQSHFRISDAHFKHTVFQVIIFKQKVMSSNGLFIFMETRGISAWRSFRISHPQTENDTRRIYGTKKEGGFP